jgi:hypothetical protein
MMGGPQGADPSLLSIHPQPQSKDTGTYPGGEADYNGQPLSLPKPVCDRGLRCSSPRALSNQGTLWQKELGRLKTQAQLCASLFTGDN